MPKLSKNYELNLYPFINVLNALIISGIYFTFMILGIGDIFNHWQEINSVFKLWTTIYIIIPTFILFIYVFMCILQWYMTLTLLPSGGQQPKKIRAYVLLRNSWIKIYLAIWILLGDWIFSSSHFHLNIYIKALLLIYLLFAEISSSIFFKNIISKFISFKVLSLDSSNKSSDNVIPKNDLKILLSLSILFLLAYITSVFFLFTSDDDLSQIMSLFLTIVISLVFSIPQIALVIIFVEAIREGAQIYNKNFRLINILLVISVILNMLIISFGIANESPPILLKVQAIGALLSNLSLILLATINLFFKKQIDFNYKYALKNDNL